MSSSDQTVVPLFNGARQQPSPELGSNLIGFVTNALRDAGWVLEVAGLAEREGYDVKQALREFTDRLIRLRQYNHTHLPDMCLFSRDSTRFNTDALRFFAGARSLHLFDKNFAALEEKPPLQTTDPDTIRRYVLEDTSTVLEFVRNKIIDEYNPTAKIQTLPALPLDEWQAERLARHMVDPFQQWPNETDLIIQIAEALDKAGLDRNLFGNVPVKNAPTGFSPFTVINGGREP